MAIPYTEEQRQAIIEQVTTRLVAGESMRKICLDKDMPDRVTMLRWFNDDSELASIIARARDIQADALMDDMSDICAKMEGGQLDPNAGKAIIWAKQWQASKMRPKKYGDRLDLGNADSKPFEVIIK